MLPYTGSFLFPTQIRNYRDAGSAIAESKDKFVDSLPPPQHIPPELRSSFTATLDAIMELVDVMEPNLHKVFLLVDKEKLDEMIGIMVYSQIQKRMCEVPPHNEPRYIMTYDDAVQSLRILTGIERVVSAAIAWSNSEDGTRFRREMNHAHAAMEASFDRWLNAVLPENPMDLPEPQLSLSHPQESTSSTSFFAPRGKASSRRPKSLPNILIKPLPETPLFTCDASPPPLSPLCRFQHFDTNEQTCRFCQAIPRQTHRPRNRLRSLFDRMQTTPRLKQPAQCSPNRSDFTSLFLFRSSSEDTDILIRPSDSVSVVNSPPSPPFSSAESSGGDSLSPIVSTSQLELRPLLPFSNRSRSWMRRSPLPSSSKAKASSKKSFWLTRFFKDFLSFL
ncbi:hypothetical protein BC629DRAFT_802272 [Irpex lacteus]|nr:hypothetical protein BC629DRAFT_802272 [Irpex lacteus]